LTKLDHRDIW